MPRNKTLTSTETDVLIASQRRCALCFGLRHDTDLKSQGQIAHVDRDASRSSFDDLAWLCLDHHDQYDSRRSQSKGFTPAELRRYRDDLYAFNARQRASLEPGRPTVTLSQDGSALAKHLGELSRNGYNYDPQVRFDTLATDLRLSGDEVELAVDELKALGWVEINGERNGIFATDRLFWEADPIFGVGDPAADAETVARTLAAQPGDQITMIDLASVIGWSPRRINPATSYLVETGKLLGTARQARGLTATRLFGALPQPSGLSVI